LFSNAYSQDSLVVSPFNEQLNQFLSVRDLSISKTGNEAYFTVQSPDESISQIATMRLKDGVWSKPELMTFNDENKYLEPFMSIDMLRLYFVSDRPQNEKKTSEKNFDIWYVERSFVDNSWSEPKNLGKPVNSDNNEFYPTLSANGNLYFTMDIPNSGRKDDIYYSKWNGKKHEDPVLLSDSVNSTGYEFNAFISNDESFLLYTKYNAENGFGSGDLYIARKDQKGNWTKAENLGNTINSKFMEYCPFYDQNSQTLYFTSKRNSLESKHFQTLEEFEKYLESGENGLSKIYGVKVKF
jgi:hypothetical protein